MIMFCAPIRRSESTDSYLEEDFGLLADHDCFAEARTDYVNSHLCFSQDAQIYIDL